MRPANASECAPREGGVQTEEFAGKSAKSLPCCLRKLSPRNRNLLEFAEGKGGGSYAFGAMAEGVGILLESRDVYGFLGGRRSVRRG